MFKLLFIIILGSLVFFNLSGSAIKKNTVKPVHYQLKKDTAKLVQRQFNADALNSYRKNPEFNYQTKKAAITWWDRFWSWLWHLWTSFWDWVAELLQKVFGHTSGKHVASVIKFFIIGMLAFMVVYIILKLLGINFLSLFKKKTTTGNLPFTESIENIHEINFDEAIEEALAVKNFRLAVRLLYLRCLKQLSDKGLIYWRIDKTNTAYLNELTNDEQRQQFTLVTRHFEYIWYGDLPIDDRSFQNINSIFQEFKRRLS